MGRVVAIAGFGQGDANVLYRYAVGLTGKEHANVLYLGTAGSDAEANVASATRRFESLGCGVRALCLITKTYTDAEIDEHLAWADMIFVGGGDTISMMRVWKEHGLDAKLKEVYRNDAAVLSGVSAGAICWFCCGHSDSESFHQEEGWHFCWAEGMLDLFHKVYCPHYNDAGRDTFDAMLEEKSDMVGVALENNVAFVENGEEQYYVRSQPNARAYELRYVSGALEKRELEIVDL